MHPPIHMSPPRDPRDRRKLEHLAGLSIGKTGPSMLKAPDGSELPMTPDLMLVLLQVAKDLCEGRSVFITCESNRSNSSSICEMYAHDGERSRGRILYKMF